MSDSIVTFDIIATFMAVVALLQYQYILVQAKRQKPLLFVALLCLFSGIGLILIHINYLEYSDLDFEIAGLSLILVGTILRNVNAIQDLPKMGKSK